MTRFPHLLAPVTIRGRTAPHGRTKRRAAELPLRPAQLRARGLETHIIGDAMAPRRLIFAIHEGHDLGRRL